MDQKGLHPGIIFAALIALAVAVAGGVYWLRSSRHDLATGPETGRPRAEAPSYESDDTGSVPSASELLPHLDDSDSLVRTVVSALSSHPRLVSWIASEEGLVRTFVAAVDQVAEGESPREQIVGFAPPRGFEAAVDDGVGALVPAPRSTSRFDLLVGIFTAIDSDSAALIYQRLRPLITEAYREIGRLDADFDQTLMRAIAELMAVPIVDRPVLEATVEGYRYRDPALESLSAAQKQLLRTGAENTRRVQAKLAELSQALGLRNVR